MTSKDELREKILLVREATLAGDLTEREFLREVLNLLEGEKQEDKRLPFTQIKFSNDMVATVEDDGKTLVIATLNKEPNKGEDVDE